LTALIPVLVEGGWSVTPAAASRTAAALIGRHGDDCSDAAPTFLALATSTWACGPGEFLEARGGAAHFSVSLIQPTSLAKAVIDLAFGRWMTRSMPCAGMEGWNYGNFEPSLPSSRSAVCLLPRAGCT
jgi:hypothetical protein